MPQTLDQEIQALESIYWSERDPEGLAFAPLADAHLRRGEVREALDLLTDGTSRHPDYATGHVVASRLYFGQGMTEEAELAARRVLRLDPDNLVGLSILASVLAARGESEAAAEHRERLLAIDPESDEARALDGATPTSTLAEEEATPAPPADDTESDAWEAPELEDALESLGLSEPGADLEVLTGDLEVVSPDLDEMSGEVVELAALAPDPVPRWEEVVDLDALAPDPVWEEVVDLAALAPDPASEPVDLADLAPDPQPEPMDVAALAPDPVWEEVVDLAALAPDPAPEPMDLADLAPDSQPELMDVAALAPDPVMEEVVELDALAPDPVWEEVVDLAALAPDLVDSGASALAHAADVTTGDRREQNRHMERSEPVYTRTLAELYVKQGFIEKALGVYRHLLEADPGATEIRARIEELESGSAGADMASTPARQAPPPLPDPVDDGIGLEAEPGTGDSTGEEEVETLARDLAESGDRGHDVSTPFAWNEDEEEDPADTGSGIGDYFDRLLAWEDSREP